MVYRLQCPACNTTSMVSADIPYIRWFCPNCAKFAYTNLPTDGDGNLIDVLGETGSLYSLGDTVQGQQVVEGEETS